MNTVGGILNHLSHLTVNLIIENINTAKDVKSTCIYFRIACWLKCRLVDVLIEGSFIWIFAVLSWFSIFFFLICCGDLNFRLKINRGWNKVGRSFITNILSEVSWTRSIYLARVFCFLLSNENFIIWSSDHGVEEHVAHGFFYWGPHEKLSLPTLDRRHWANKRSRANLSRGKCFRQTTFIKMTWK